VSIDPPSGPYLSNSTAIVSALPGAGWFFLYWLGDAAGTNPTTTVVVERTSCVEAVFGTEISANTVGAGAIQLSPAMRLFPYGTKIKLTAVPDAGQHFALWANAVSGTNNPSTLIVANPAPSLTGVFAALTAGRVALTVIEEGEGRVVVSPKGSQFPTGTMVSLQAVADPGQEFVSWEGDASGTQNPLLINLNSSKRVTANFTARPLLSLSGCGEGYLPEGFRFSLMGRPELEYVIQATSNLVNWTSIGTVTNPFGRLQFTDRQIGPGLYQFYRASSP
jgi:hypothetical protein